MACYQSTGVNGLLAKQFIPNAYDTLLQLVALAVGCTGPKQVSSSNRLFNSDTAANLKNVSGAVNAARTSTLANN